MRAESSMGWALVRSLTATGLITLGLFGWTVSPAGAQSDASPPPFNGSGAALGVQVTVVVPNFPATNEPVDSGGPTAQVAANSLGSSTGYAALPDPGQFVTTVPGLVTGLVGGGAAGLPPVALPTLPNYPLYIATNADSNPQQSIGSGPYELTATSETDSSEATAVGGFQIEAAGNVALVKSNATISASADGTSVTATSDVQGLSIGPLDIGEISSSATETLEPDGTVTPSSSMTITGIEIGGLPIGVLVPNGLEGAGETIPLPINSILAKILSVAGISATVETAQTFSGTVDSPALQITMPVTVPSIGPGTVTLTFGSTSASMVGSASASDGLGSLGGGTSPSSISTGSASSQTASPSSTTTSSLPVAPSTAGSEVAGAGLSPPSASSAGNPVGSSQVASPTSGSSVSIRPVVASSPQYTGVFGVFGIKTLYLVVTLGALASLVISQLIRILGIRRPWTYNGG